MIKEHFEGVTEDCQEDSLTFDDIDFFPSDQLEVKATEEESNTSTHEEQPTTPTASSPTAHYGESDINIEEPGCYPQRSFDALPGYKMHLDDSLNLLTSPKLQNHLPTKKPRTVRNGKQPCNLILIPSLETRHAWELLDLPPGHKPITCQVGLQD